MHHRFPLVVLALGGLAASACAGSGSVTPEPTSSSDAGTADASTGSTPSADDPTATAPNGGGVGVGPSAPTSSPPPSPTGNVVPSPANSTAPADAGAPPSTDDTATAPMPSTTPVDTADAGLPSSDEPEAGATNDSSNPAPSPVPSDGSPPAGQVPALVAVGYGGLRVVSRDNGETWGDQVHVERSGGDDQNLLRAVTYGNGRWLTTGWRLWTSPDAVEWQDHGLVNDRPGLSACNIVEGLAFADGHFYAACYNGGPGMVFRSSDGLTWTEFSTIGNTNQHLFLDYRDGQFIAYGDTNTSFMSQDALEWETLPGVTDVTYCENEFKSARECHGDSWFNGAYYRAEWGGYIYRSTDGQRYVEVYVDDSDNNLYRSRSIGSGFAAP